MIALLLAVMTQEPPAPALRRLTEAHAATTRIGYAKGDSIWPAFRLDTIPVLYLLPDTGTLLLGWRGDLPEGYARVAHVPNTGWPPRTSRGAANTGTSLAGRPAAQVVAGNASVAQLVGLTAHEAFHVFQGVARRPGRRFGTGENSFLVSTYPVFDAANEAAVALEGRILAAALAATDPMLRRDFAQQFVAVREGRHRALPDEFSTFERMGELNEGLAEYAMVTTLLLASRDQSLSWAAEARDLVEEGTTQLKRLASDRTRSIRLRLYASGVAQARLLDAIEGPAWKSRLLRDDLTLQDALAGAVGSRDGERAARRRAQSGFDHAALRLASDSGIAGLRTLRRAQVDSIMAAPGVALVVAFDSLAPNRVGLCNIDPQNLLQVDDGVLLHTRTVRACAGSAFDATFTTPTVDERSRGAIRAVIGPIDSLRVTVAGKPLELRDGTQMTLDLKIEGSRILLISRRAEVVLSGSALTIRPRQ